MPKASGRHVKYWPKDHDADVVSLAPPVQNQWYEVFHGYNVQLSWCQIRQTNGEAAVKTIQVRWTIDGTVYLYSYPLANNTLAYLYRNVDPSTGGTLGILDSTLEFNCERYSDKFGQDFKVEIRITSALGTNQTLRCYCVRETLEETPFV